MDTTLDVGIQFPFLSITLHLSPTSQGQTLLKLGAYFYTTQKAKGVFKATGKIFIL